MRGYKNCSDREIGNTGRNPTISDPKRQKGLSQFAKIYNFKTMKLAKNGNSN
jgi:hypothetical protein